MKARQLAARRNWASLSKVCSRTNTEAVVFVCRFQMPHQNSAAFERAGLDRPGEHLLGPIVIDAERRGEKGQPTEEDGLCETS